MAPKKRKLEPVSWGKKMLRASLRRKKGIPENDDPPSPSPSNSYPSYDRDSDPSFVPIPPSNSDDSSEDSLPMNYPMVGFKEKVLSWNQVTLGHEFHEDTSNQESMIIARQDRKTQKSTQHDTITEESTQRDTITEESTQRDTITEESTQRDTNTEESTQRDTITEESTQRDTNTEESTQRDTNTEESTQPDTITEESTQRDTITEKSTQRDTITEESTQRDTNTEESTQRDTITEESTQRDTITEEFTQCDTNTEESTQRDTITEESTQRDTITEGSTQPRHESSEITNNKKKPKRMCKFCQQWQTHLTRHIRRKHKSEEEVILAARLPGKDQERAFASMRKGGIFKANAAARQADRDATLIRERRQGSANTVMCTGCLGFYDAKNIFRHKKVCTKEMSTQPDTVKMTELSESSLALNVDNDFKCNVLDRFRNDPVGDICRNDLVTILLGKKLWVRSVKKERSTVMAEMRLMGNMISNFRNITDNESASGLDVLDFRQFDALEKVIKKLAEKESGNGGEKTGLKVRIGYVLRKSVEAMKGYSVMKCNFEQEKNLSRFLDVLNLNWNFIFYVAQVENEQRRGGLRKPSAMPLEEDIVTFKNYLVDEMEKGLNSYELWDKHSWVKMRNLVVSRLLMFNARRGGEPSRLSLNEWREAVTGAWIDPNLVEGVTDPMEKYLIDKLKLAYQAGKGSRKLVPVLFPEDTIEPITKLLAERINCDVNEENPFLFPSTKKSMDHASGYHCLKAAVCNCPNLKQPDLLIADKFRHRVSTLFAQLDLPEEQRHLFYRHMGHSESINRNVYQCPLAINEITRVGDFLLNTVDLQSRNDSNSRQPAEETSQTDELPMEVFDISGSGPSQNEEVLAGPSVETQMRPGIKSDSRVRRYTKWSVEDSNLVETHFKKFITDISNKGCLPSKKEVQSFLSNHDILQGHDNKADLVRTKIFNQKAKYRNCFKKNSE